MRESTEQRRQSESVVNARSRIAVLGQTVGTHHPSYATSLNQLAMLLIMQGEAEEAESYLRSALEIRREALGENHPDYATNLSSLGGLLWARGDLAGAEPLLRNAMEIRVATLGPKHPKSVVSKSSLEQLLEAKLEQVATPVDCAAITVITAPKPVEPVPAVVSETAIASVSEIAARLATLLSEFQSLGGQLESASHLIRNAGVLPDLQLAESVEAVGARFRDLIVTVCRFALSHGIRYPEGGIENLNDVAGLIPTFEAAEATRDQIAAVKCKAESVFDRVERLTYPADLGFAPLSRCREVARSLRNQVRSTGPMMLVPEVESLLEGSHPLSAVLGLASGDDSVDDAEWARWFEIVEKEFGRSLAVVAARSKVRVGDS